MFAVHRPKYCLASHQNKDPEDLIQELFCCSSRLGRQFLPQHLRRPALKKPIAFFESYAQIELQELTILNMVRAMSPMANILTAKGLLVSGIFYVRTV
jgi:hypothetical protein